MIVFEDRLAELVGVLPKLTVNSKELQVNFDWGTEVVLAKYLLMNGKMSFPLIWLVEGVDNNDLLEPSVTRDARLVVLYESQAPDEFNTYQHKYYYDLVLQPILDNLLTALAQSGMSRYDDKMFRTQRIKNYSMRGGDEINSKIKEKTNQSLLFICNAIVLDAKITLTGNCINKNIQFNN